MTNHNNFLQQFIDKGLDKWEQIKKEFSYDKDLFRFLSKSEAIIMFDHHQLDMNFARNLYNESAQKRNNLSPEDLKQEAFRKETISYFEKCKELSIEIRFPAIKIEYIQKLKSHPDIKDLNCQCAACIKVVICNCKTYK